MIIYRNFRIILMDNFKYHVSDLEVTTLYGRNFNSVNDAKEFIDEMWQNHYDRIETENELLHWLHSGVY